MFDLFTGATSSDCTGMSRRSFLRVGALSGLGLAAAAIPADDSHRRGNRDS